ncbi:MAG: hypothetical protein ABI777_08520 [Betaproteobacteria bacterium]
MLRQSDEKKNDTIGSQIQAKAKPGALNFAVSGIGGANHLPATPEMQERLMTAGAETRAGTRAEFGGVIHDETARLAKVVKEAGEKFE